MSVASAATIKLGIDAEDCRKGLQQVMKDVDKASKQVAANAERERKRAADAAEKERLKRQNEPVLERDNKVENQLVGLVNRLGEVRNGADLAAVSLEAMAESVQLSLGAAVVAGVAVGVIKTLVDISEQAKEARKELDALLQPTGSPDFSSLQEIETRLGNLKKKLDDLREDKGWWASLKEILGESSLLGGEGGSFDDVAKRREEQANAILQRIERAKSDSASKTADQNKVIELTNSGQERAAELEQIRQEYAEKIGAAINEQNIGLHEQLKIQQRLKEDAVNQKFDKQEAEEQKKLIEDVTKAARDAMKRQGEADKKQADDEKKIISDVTAAYEQTLQRQGQADQKRQQIFNQAEEAMEKVREETRRSQEEADKRSESEARESMQRAKDVAETNRKSADADLSHKAEIAGRTSQIEKLRLSEEILNKQRADLLKKKEVAQEERDEPEIADIEAELGEIERKRQSIALQRVDLNRALARAVAEVADAEARGAIEALRGRGIKEDQLADELEIELLQRQMIRNSEEMKSADELRTAELKKQNVELQNQTNEIKRQKIERRADQLMSGPGAQRDARRESRRRGRALRRAEREEALDHKGGLSDEDWFRVLRNSNDEGFMRTQPKRVRDAVKREHERINRKDGMHGMNNPQQKVDISGGIDSSGAVKQIASDIRDIKNNYGKAL